MEDNWDAVVAHIRQRRRGLAKAMYSSSSSEYSTSPSPSPLGSDSGSSAPSTPLYVELKLSGRVAEGANHVGKNTCEPDPEDVLQPNRGGLIPPPEKLGSSSFTSFAPLSASRPKRRSHFSNEDGDDESPSSEKINKRSFTNPSRITGKDSVEDYENDGEDEREYLDMRLVRSMFNDDIADSARPPLALPPLPSPSSDPCSHEKSHSSADSSSNRLGKLRPRAKSSSSPHALRSTSEKNAKHAEYMRTLRERRTQARLSMYPPPCPPQPLPLPSTLPSTEKSSYKPRSQFSEYKRELLDSVLAIERSFSALEQKGDGSETGVNGLWGMKNVPGGGGKQVRSWVVGGNEADVQSAGKVSSNDVNLDSNVDANADRLRRSPSLQGSLSSRRLALLFPPLPKIGPTLVGTKNMDANMAAASTTTSTDANANTNCAPPIAPEGSRASGLPAPTKPTDILAPAIALTLKTLLANASEENTKPVAEPKHKPNQKTTFNSRILPEPDQLPVRPLARSISPFKPTFSVSTERSGSGSGCGVISAGGFISTSASSSTSVWDADANGNLHAKRNGREFPAPAPVMGLGLRVPKVCVGVDASGVTVNGRGDCEDGFVCERGRALDAGGGSLSLSSMPPGAVILKSGSNSSRSSTSSFSSVSSTTTWPPILTLPEFISFEYPSSKWNKKSRGLKPKTMREADPSISAQLLELPGILEPKLTRKHILMRRQKELVVLHRMKTRDEDDSGMDSDIITRRIRGADGIVLPPFSGSLLSGCSSCLGPSGRVTVSGRF